MGRSIVRLKDIADKTGFSTNTVSLALRQSPRIPQQTRDIIQRALQQTQFNRTQAASLLGISVRQLRYSMQKLEISAPED